MTISPHLLEILVCPVTKLPVSLMSKERLLKLNDLIGSNEVNTKDGKLLSTPLLQALITSNNSTIYQVIDDIPIMLEDQAIDAKSLPLR
jgi:uncharacterized protein YbaR (Trm112 family)